MDPADDPADDQQAKLQQLQAELYSLHKVRLAQSGWNRKCSCDCTHSSRLFRDMLTRVSCSCNRL